MDGKSDITSKLILTFWYFLSISWDGTSDTWCHIHVLLVMQKASWAWYHVTLCGKWEEPSESIKSYNIVQQCPTVVTISKMITHQTPKLTVHQLTSKTLGLQHDVVSADVDRCRETREQQEVPWSSREIIPKWPNFSTRELWNHSSRWFQIQSGMSAPLRCLLRQCLQQWLPSNIEVAKLIDQRPAAPRSWGLLITGW